MAKGSLMPICHDFCRDSTHPNIQQYTQAQQTPDFATMLAAISNAKVSTVTASPTDA